MLGSGPLVLIDGSGFHALIIFDLKTQGNEKYPFRISGDISLIQILALRDFQDKDTGRVRKAEVWFSKGIRAPSVEFIFNSPLEFIEAKVPESERVNLYYTVSECLEESGRKFLRQHHIPFDIDGLDIPEGITIDYEKLETTARVACKALKIDYDKTGVLFSGNGLQLLVGIKTPIEDPSYFDEARPHYKALCNRIDLALMAESIQGKADVAVWSPARLMRYPETLNSKPGKPKRVGRILQRNIERIEFDLEKASGLPKLIKGDFITREAMKHYPTPDSQTILDREKGCQFLSWMKDFPSEVNEPLWYAGLSILPLLSREKAHEYSKGHKGYTYEETETKINQAMTSSGPRTCKNINDLWGKCSTCPHFKEDIKSPILIRSGEHIATKENGFYHIAFDKEGNPKPGKPDYEGMIQFLINELGPYRVLPDANFIYQFNGKFYEEISKDECKRFAYEAMEPKPHSSILEEFWKRMKMFGDGLVRPEWLQDSVKNKVCFQNGVYDTSKHEFIPHSADFGFMGALNCNYDPKAISPNFDRFLEEVTQSDVDLQNILLEFMGYSLVSSDCRYQKALILLGEGSNGKSTLLDSLKKLLNKNYSGLSLKNMQDDQKRYLMMGKLVNIAEENSYDSFRDIELVKNFVTGGDISVKKVYMPPFEYQNTTKLIISCNELPYTRDITDGFFRRFIIVPFNATFSEELGNADLKINEKLTVELPGIFNRILEGWYRLEKQDGFTKAASSREVLESYKDDSSPHALWFKENVEVKIDEGTFTTLQEIYEDYRKTTVDSGYRNVLTKSQLKKFLRKQLKNNFKESRRHEPNGSYVRVIPYVQIHTTF